MKAEFELEVETSMVDCKRVAVMTATNNAGCMSKRRRISGSPERLRPSASRSDLGDRCLWLENATTSLSRLEKKNSLDIVAGGEMRYGFSEDQFPVSCSSSDDCGKATVVKFEDLEVSFQFLVEEILPLCLFGIWFLILSFSVLRLARKWRRRTKSIIKFNRFINHVFYILR